MKKFLKVLAFGAIGAFGGGLYQVSQQSDIALTTGNVLIPALGSAAASILALLTQNPYKIK